VKKSTIVLSVLLHGGVAAAVINAAGPGSLKRTFSVQMTEMAKKKPEPKPKADKPQPPKPQPKLKAAGPAEPPKPVANAPAPKLADAPEPKAAVAAMPTLDNIEMSNADDGSPGGVVVPVARPAAAAAVRKVASMQAEAPRRPRRELGAGPQLDESCHEEPSKPEPVFKTEIEYTHAARAEGIEGKLTLRLTVGADGSVVNVEVLSSVSPELDAAAVAAVRQWRFKPAMACGKPVHGGIYKLNRRFELGD
jgi:periplasmic protein TonB